MISIYVLIRVNVFMSEIFLSSQGGLQQQKGTKTCKVTYEMGEADGITITRKEKLKRILLDGRVHSRELLLCRLVYISLDIRRRNVDKTFRHFFRAHVW